MPLANQGFLGENPCRAESHWPPAVIGGAFQTGVLGVRTLTRRGVHAVCFDSNPDNPGFRSVYGPARLCPNPDTDSEAWACFMVELAEELGGRPVLICSSDQFVSAIARHRELLAGHYILSAGAAMQGLLADKCTQYGLAATHGMPMPRTQVVGSVTEAEAFARNARFPCVLKPAHFRLWQRLPSGHPLCYRKVAIAENAERLLEYYELASAVSAEVIMQEVIEGPDTDKRVYLACYDANSRRVAHAMFRELRCDPVGFGPATVSEPVIDEETDTVCDRFLRQIRYVGICEIEMKWDARDRQVKLIEANPRLSGGGDAAPYAGVDLCWIQYLDLIGELVTSVAPRDASFRHVVLRNDGHTVATYWREGLISWRDICRSYRPPLAFFDLDRKDWRYSAETLLIAAKGFVRGLLWGGR